MLADREMTAHTAAPDASASICPRFTMDARMHAFQQGRQSNHIMGGWEAVLVRALKISQGPHSLQTIVQVVL